MSCSKEVTEYFLGPVGIFSYRDFVLCKVLEVGSKILVKRYRGKTMGTEMITVCSMVNSVKSMELVDFLSSVIAIQCCVVIYFATFSILLSLYFNPEVSTVISVVT